MGVENQTLILYKSNRFQNISPVSTLLFKKEETSKYSIEVGKKEREKQNKKTLQSLKTVLEIG